MMPQQAVAELVLITQTFYFAGQGTRPNDIYRRKVSLSTGQDDEVMSAKEDSNPG